MARKTFMQRVADNPVVTQSVIMAVVLAAANFGVASLRLAGIDPPGYWLEAGQALLTVGVPIIWALYVRSRVSPVEGGRSDPTE